MSTGKRLQYNYDTPFPNAVATADALLATTDTIVPVVQAGPAPEGLTIVSVVAAPSMTTPRAIVNAAWTAPIAGVSAYVVQIGLQADFSDAATYQVLTTSAAMEVRAPISITVTYYVRVAALYGTIQSAWSDVATAAVQPDTSAPPAATNLVASFDNDATLRVAWDNPLTANNLKDAQIVLWNADRTIQYVQEFVGDRFTWTAAQNLAATSGAGVASVLIEVRTRSFSNALSAIVSTTATLPAPAAAGSVAASWDARAGSTTWTWTVDATVTRAVLIIDGVARSVADTRYSYSLALNRLEHSGTPDPSLTWSLVVYNALGMQSTAVTGTATLPPPATPNTILTSFPGLDASWTWLQSGGVVDWVLTIDGVAHVLLDQRSTYSFATNQQEHGGSADPNLAWSLVARDALGQSSTAASGALVNAPPAAPLSVSAFADLNGVSSFIDAAMPDDFDAFQVRVLKDGTQISAYDSQERAQRFPTDASGSTAFVAGSYQFAAKVRDRFGQLSAEVTSSAQFADPLTTASLRSETSYTDDLGTASATLDILKTDGTSGGITYSP